MQVLETCVLATWRRPNIFKLFLIFYINYIINFSKNQIFNF